MFLKVGICLWIR